MERFIRFAETSCVDSNASITHLGQLIKLVFKQLMAAGPTVQKQNGLLAFRIQIFNIYVYIASYLDIVPHIGSSFGKSPFDISYYWSGASIIPFILLPG
jgi:hypothetical protein